jgi:hypothetical protein
MTSLQSLIEIYARCKSTSVQNDPAFVALDQQNSDSPTRSRVFHEQVARVERIKRGLEDIVDIQTTYQGEVKLSLQKFQQLADSSDQEDEICLRLIRLTYYPNWTPKQTAFFDKMVEAIKKGHDYFLSFTQRRPPGGGNPLNSDQRYLIQSFGLADPQGKDENELARMLDRLLRISKYGFRGFFYPMHENDSQQVKKKLNDAMNNSLVFIQLVQNEMFSKQYPIDPNYCFDEYSGACSEQKKMVLIFANGLHPGDMIIKTAVQSKFNAWYDYMHGADCVDLQPTRISEQAMNIQTNRDKLTKGVVEKLQELRKEILESVPGDLD